MQKNIFYDFQLQTEILLTQNRVAKLAQDVGILDDNDDIIWNKKLKELILYCRENGKCPRRKEDLTLNHWIQNNDSICFLEKDKQIE